MAQATLSRLWWAMLLRAGWHFLFLEIVLSAGALQSERAFNREHHCDKAQRIAGR